jgi:hypothetical protein
MTIFFPDVANFQRGLVIQPGTPFVWAKATEGTAYKDDTYLDFKAQAAKVGAGFGAYHFLHSGNGSAQADFAFSVVGKGVPLMVDVEPTGTSYPTVADVKAFTARYRALGGTCEVMYYPKWYWSSQGSPSLSVTGLKLISSGYPAGYSDSSANWDPYGGLTPFQWQFSDSYEYGGLRVDFNAYKGTIDQYLVDIGTKTVTPPPAPNPPSTPEDDDMQQIESLVTHPGEYAYAVAGKGHVRFVADGYGAKASLRVVLWEGGSLNILQDVEIGQGYVDLPISPTLTTAVTVRRLDKGDFPVGVSAY